MPGSVYHAHVNDLPRETRFAGQYQRVGAISDHALVSFVWIEPDGDVPAGQLRGGLHSHSFDQMIYLISGNRTFVVGDREYRLVPGDVLYIPADVPHGGKAEPGDDTAHFLELFAPIRTDYLYTCEHQTTQAAPERLPDGSREDTRPTTESLRSMGDARRH